VGRCPDCVEGFGKCPQCDGKGIYDKKCPWCGGDGVVKSHRNPDGSLHHSLCRTCGAKGIVDRDRVCEKCGKTGKVKCRTCRGKGWAKYLPSSAAVESVFTEGPCPVCGGSGTQFRNAMVGCSLCGGLGLKLIPTADPSATLDAREEDKPKEDDPPEEDEWEG
jgi:DnaJ-class molecular chaperone